MGLPQASGAFLFIYHPAHLVILSKRFLVFEDGVNRVCRMGLHSVHPSKCYAGFFLFNFCFFPFNLADDVLSVRFAPP
jgi:hypothetical protein